MHSNSVTNFSHLSPREALISMYQYLSFSLQEVREWKIIPGYPNYEINSAGKIRSNHSYGGRARILSPTLRNNRYFYVSLSAEGNRVGFPVDKLMIMAFHNIPKEEIRKVIHHDNIKHNNQLNNLSFVLWNRTNYFLS